MEDEKVLQTSNWHRLWVYLKEGKGGLGDQCGTGERMIVWIMVDEYT